MNYLWHHMLRQVYRRYPVPSVILTMGIMEMAIAGANGRWPLLTIGGGMTVAALGLYNQQRRRWYPEKPRLD